MNTQLPDISEILLRGGNEPNPDLRREAENQITMMLETNFALALCTLTNEIAQETKNIYSRRIAGAVFKNALSALSSDARLAKEEAWLKIDPALRGEMKNKLLQTLNSKETYAADAAASVISRVAQIELPRNEWNELIEVLLSNVSGQVEASVKVSSLKTLGFICEEMDPETMGTSRSDRILTAIISGMRRDTQNVDIIVSACEAFYNCLKFIEKNFNVEAERTVIMETLIDTASIPSPLIQTNSLMCLVEIAHLYYFCLDPYMDKIFNLTFGAIKSGTNEVACQAIEFWSTVCDEEYELSEDDDESYLRLIVKAVPVLLPALLECYQKRDYDDDDEDSQNVAIVASLCVRNITSVVQDMIVDQVLPVVQKNITDPDWQKKDSATQLFADILEGPSDEKMLPLVTQIFPALVEQLKNESEHLRDTTCWTIARICDLHPSFCVQHVNYFLETLHPHLSGPPQIANHCCFAIHNIAVAFEKEATNETNALSRFFLFLIEELLKVAYRNDGHDIGLRASAFEAIASVISNGAKDTAEGALKTVPHFLEKLNETFHMPLNGPDDRERQIQLQGYHCTILGKIIEKVKDEIQPFEAPLLERLLALLRYHQQGGESTSIHEDVMMLLGTIVCAIEGRFEQYLPAFMPFILQAMCATKESSLIKNCVCLVTDLAQTLRKKFLELCQGLIEPLFNALKDESLDRNVKPLIISCLGDIANAIGDQFEPYLMMVCQVLVAASATSRGDLDDEGYQEFLTSLRVSIFDAYTGIIQGLVSDKKGVVFLPYGQYMMQFIDLLVEERQQLEERNFDDPTGRNVLQGMVGVIGDLAEIGGSDVAMLLNRPSVARVLREASDSEEDSMKSLAEWANRVVAKVVSNR